MARSSIPPTLDEEPGAPGIAMASAQDSEAHGSAVTRVPRVERGLRAFLGAVVSDLDRQYRGKTTARKMAGFFLNASMHACLLVRCCQFSPKWLHWLFRDVLIWKHGIDISPGIHIGSALSLPHPTGIVIGSGCIIDDEVTLYQGVTLGVKNDGYPWIGRGVTVYPGAVVVGPIRVGRGATVGALAFVDKDIGVGVRFRGR